MLILAQSRSFNITLARAYRWQTEKSNEGLEFLHTLVDLFRSVSGGSLQVIGLPEPGTRKGEINFRWHG
jgi:hypothetical protein